MDSFLLFPFANYWWLYGLFTLFVLGMLALDLGVFHRDAHEVSFKEALAWSIVWVSLAMLFCLGFWKYAQWRLPQYTPLLDWLSATKGLTGAAAAAQAIELANQTALEFLTGFIVEKALSVDNIFVFVVVFSYFAVPPKYQHRVLFYGILGALVFRIIFISLGAVLMKFHVVILIFGAFLVLTGIKIIFSPEKPIDPEKNPFIRLVRRFLPVTSQFEGQRFFIRRDGILYATPLFICLVFIEVTDIVFAVDSVPAIFAITDEPLIVFTSNVFAILGLRAMFFLLAGVMHRFWCLKYGLGMILIFVGLKMAWLNEAFGGKFPITWSLAIIATLLAVSVTISLAFPRKPDAVAHK
jgi:tellurite resistance protein TerC